MLENPNGVLRLLSRAGNMISKTVTTRRFYSGWGNYARANWLRLTETRFTRSLLTKRGRRTALHIRGYDGPIFVRRANSDFNVVQEIFEQGEYAPILKMGIPLDGNILDLGANIGLMAIYLNIHFPRCRVVSVEPDGDNCRMFRDNCDSILKTGRLQLFQGFVAAKDGFASLRRDVMDGQSWSFQKVESTGDERITCYSVPTLCRTAGFETIDLLKCDVEGTEVELFANCSDWIGKVRNLVVETHGQYGPPELQAALRAAGWNFRVTIDRGTVVFLSKI